jgi:hypothetical protein
MTIPWQGSTIQKVDADAHMLLVSSNNDSAWLDVPESAASANLDSLRWQEAALAWAMSLGAKVSTPPSQMKPQGLFAKGFLNIIKDVVQQVASPTALQHREPELPKRQLWTKDKENQHSQQQQRSRSSSDSDGSEDAGNPAALPSQNAEEGSSSSPCASTGRRKKKKTGAARKKAKAAAKRGSTPKLTAVKAPPAPPAIPAKQFRFGPVHIAYYERDIGSCCVPSDGSWALGLGERVPYSASKEFATVPLDTHDAQRAERLAERAASLTKREKKACRGETRQWDFKLHNNRNPLFGRLSEKARRELLLGVADEAPRDPAHTLHTLHDEFVERSTELLHELDAIRRSRSTGGGCACAPLKVDKLPVTRLKEVQLQPLEVCIEYSCLLLCDHCVITLCVMAAYTSQH